MISRPFDFSESLPIPDERYLRECSTDELCTELTTLARKVNGLSLRPSNRELREMADQWCSVA